MTDGTRPLQTPHGNLLQRKSVGSKELEGCLAAYKKFAEDAEQISVVDAPAISKLVNTFNEYRNSSIYIFEEGKNVPQENLRSTMLEEFFGWLFKDIFKLLNFEKPNNYIIGKTTSSYLTLTFAPKEFRSLFADPNPRISTKDQDFAIGASMRLLLSPPNAEPTFAQDVTLPVVAIECKTYLAKNHLDMCSSTAQMLRRANPYCIYMIAAEFLKMDAAVTPEVTDIAEIFVLCKAENASRAKRKTAGDGPHPIHDDVVVELFLMVVRHLKAIWWDPETALARGKVISRPF